MKILVINPGSTSTKIAVYSAPAQDEAALPEADLMITIRHSVEDLSPFPAIPDQFDFRRRLVIETLSDHHIPLQFDAVIGRGGLVKPIAGGVYEINEALRHDLMHAKRLHASNLGGLLAHSLAASIPNCRAFIADPVVVDELDDVARISGLPQLPKVSIFHALNHKATARRYAREQGKPYEDLNLVVCHLGGGISVAAHRAGRVVDVNNALDGEGPFSPERAGTLPVGQLIDLCYSGQYTAAQLQKMVCGQGGVVAHLGTTDMIDVEERVMHGDQYATLIMNALIYQTAKAAGAAAVVLYGKVDAILLTGGMAHSPYIISRLQERLSFIAPIHVYPGEDEMSALAENAVGVLRGEMMVKEY